MKFSDSDCLEVYVQEGHTLSFVVGKSRSRFWGRIFNDMRRQSMFIILSVKTGGYKQCVWNNRKGGEKAMCVHVCVCVRECVCVSKCV